MDCGLNGLTVGYLSPLDWINPKASSIHFLAEALRLLLCRLTHQAMAAAQLNVLGNLVPDIVIESANAIVAQKTNIIH